MVSVRISAHLHLHMPSKPSTNRSSSSTRIPKVAKIKGPAEKIADDGLRYTKKAVGSPFIGNLNTFGGSTLSCLFCGKHRRANERTTQKVAGRNQQVCEPPCATNSVARKAAAALAAAGGPDT